MRRRDVRCAHGKARAGRAPAPAWSCARSSARTSIPPRCGGRSASHALEPDSNAERVSTHQAYASHAAGLEVEEGVQLLAHADVEHRVGTHLGIQCIPGCAQDGRVSLGVGVDEEDLLDPAVLGDDEH